MTWRVIFDHQTAYLIGPKNEARRRLAVCGDSSPVWSKLRDAWATSTDVGNRVLDQLEGRNVFVPVEHHDQEELDLTETEPANVDRTERQGVIW
ncbi:hypothetical protein ncot_13495 [Nocardioides sp. JQ2195]|uniref:hypothetical protein n=1 Tax=Nocardioides sp. JQ2195 TaxID=2592334 RepID=UPI00143EB454|nr:hypothetical protein [Nocardioides sp. JQ2195]QIX27510.1 hypothetical protein ncot_13495 [Nocardioides sp. JQ2195]